ncbi:MAG: hypothetical protein J6K98_00105 [Clostridia bacterium]|nr:hypothetical protein [Clostridia bacterium]
MGDILLTAAVLLMALFGCAQGIRWLSGRLLTGGSRQALLLLPLSGHCEDVEFRVRSCLHTASGLRRPLLVVDTGLDPESRALAEEICRRFEGVWLCDRENLDKIDLVGLQDEKKGI